MPVFLPNAANLLLHLLCSLLLLFWLSQRCNSSEFRILILFMILNTTYILPNPKFISLDETSLLNSRFICPGGGDGLVAKSCLTLATPWTIAHQAPLSMAFSRQEYWSGLPFPSPSYALLPIKHLCRSNRHLRLSCFNCTPPTQHLPISILKVKVAQSCPTLCDPMDYTVHGVLQARILEWVAFPFSRGTSQPRNRTRVSCIAGGLFTSWATREVSPHRCISWWQLHPSSDSGQQPWHYLGFLLLSHTLLPGHQEISALI